MNNQNPNTATHHAISSFREEKAIKFQRLTPTAILPTRGTKYSTGLDLYADERISLAPGAFAAIATGFNIQLPEGFEGQVRPRSGLAAKYGVTVLNAPGSIDNDYTGHLKVILINHGPGTFDVKPGDRIAQLVVTEARLLPAVEVTELDTNESRGAAGFGSTGR